MLYPISEAEFQLTTPYIPIYSQLFPLNQATCGPFPADHRTMQYPELRRARAAELNYPSNSVYKPRTIINSLKSSSQKLYLHSDFHLNEIHVPYTSAEMKK